MKRIHNITQLFAALLLLALGSCDDTWIMYDTSQRDHLYFEVETTPNVSFSLLSDTEIDYTIPIRIMGMPVDRDRTFSLEFIDALPDEKLDLYGQEVPVVTGRPGTDYTVGELLLPAGAVEGKVNLTLHRQEVMKQKYVSIHFRIAETDEFLPLPADSTDIRHMLLPEYRLFVSDGDPLCPDWWDASNAKDDLFGWMMYTGRYYPDKFRRLLDLFWETETTSPVFYQTCVEKYGRNLDKEGIKSGFFISENPAAWATYVLIPLYQYYKQYYAEHPDDPNAEVFAASGSSGTYWKDPTGMLR